MLDMRHIHTSELDTFGGRVAWLLRTRRKKQVDMARGMGRSESSVSEIVNDRKQFDWQTTAEMVTYLETNADFFLGLSEDASPVAERDGKAALNYLHVETDAVARIMDDAPEWLRRQMLATVRAQMQEYQDTVQEEANTDWAMRLRNATAVFGLVIGDDQARKFLSQVEDIVRSAARHLTGKDSTE